MRYILILLMIAHWLDALFTYLLIKKASKRYKNPEELELNYHKYFMKKLGLKRGMIMSIIISSTILFSISYFSSENAVIFISGICVAMAYANYMGWVTYDGTIKKLKRNNH